MASSASTACDHNLYCTFLSRPAQFSDKISNYMILFMNLYIFDVINISQRILSLLLFLFSSGRIKSFLELIFLINLRRHAVYDVRCTSPTLLIPQLLTGLSQRNSCIEEKNLYVLKREEVRKLDKNLHSSKSDEIRKVQVTTAHQPHREKKRWKVEKFQLKFWKLMYKTNYYKLVVLIKATVNWGPSIKTANSKFPLFQLQPAASGVGGAI